jgi:hypothetical protein
MFRCSAGVATVCRIMWVSLPSRRAEPTRIRRGWPSTGASSVRPFETSGTSSQCLRFEAVSYDSGGGRHRIHGDAPRRFASGLLRQSGTVGAISALPRTRRKLRQRSGGRSGERRGSDRALGSTVIGEIGSQLAPKLEANLVATMLGLEQDGRCERSLTCAVTS